MNSLRVGDGSDSVARPIRDIPLLKRKMNAHRQRQVSLCASLDMVHRTSSFATGVITLSWYSLGCFQFFRSLPIWAEEFLNETPARPNVPVYLWDIYKNGMNSGGNPEGADVVRGVSPKYLGPFYRNRFYPNHGKQEIKFNIPKGILGERLVEAEIRIVTDDIRQLGVSLHLFHKQHEWVFLDAKSIPREGKNWIALKVMPAVKIFKRTPKELSFLILSIFRKVDENCNLMKNLRPLLLLSYTSYSGRNGNYNKSGMHLRDIKFINENLRHKRSIFENYEENTNRIWEGDTVSNALSKKRNACTRKPLYIEFSEINFDSWIVAPTGYEAFQCVGKCTFPVSEHLSPTKHAIVQILMHHVSPTKVPRACCVPTRLDPISVLYVDGEGILTYRFRYPDMVVAECGCR